MLLHGLLGSPGNFERTAHALLDADVPLLAPTYGRRGTIGLADSTAEVLSCVTAAVAHSPTGRVDIVGHSLGGLLGLRCAHALPGAVRTLVGLGAVFRGLPPGPNRLLRWGVGVVAGDGARELMVAEPFEATVPQDTRVVSLYSGVDRVVPAGSSRLGEVVELPGVRHEYLPGEAEAICRALAWRP